MKILTIVCAALAISGVTAPATMLPVNIILNPSFEANTFPGYPGYITDAGNTPISNWTASDPTHMGLNPSAGTWMVFADNGTVPDGSNVAFLQGNNINSETLSQAVTGFAPGDSYQLVYRENGTSYDTTYATASEVFVVDTGLNLTNVIVTSHAVLPVGGTSPYNAVTSSVFVATSPTLQLVYVNLNPNSAVVGTALVDAFQLYEVIPEPSTFALLGLGGLLAWRRRNLRSFDYAQDKF